MKSFQSLLSFLFVSFALLFSWFLPQDLSAQSGGKYATYFEEAYQKYPGIPAGVLEAVAYTNTRMNHLQPTPGQACTDIPLYFGVMGLVEDGKGYFQNSLEKVAELSGYSAAEIKRDPRINILAFAAAYSSVQTNKRLANRGIDAHKPILAELTEIPNDNSFHNDFARDQQFFGILQEMQTPHTNTGHRLRQLLNYEEIFGAETLKLLEATRLTLRTSDNRNVPSLGPPNRSLEDSNQRTTCTVGNETPDFAGALWDPANSRNYGSRDGESVQYVTIHTIQGSYASAISWFKNRNARVSAHYIIRASDGQITQMVCESDKAFHVKTDNPTTIGIEHEGFIDDGAAWYTNEMYESSAALVRDICKRYNIDPLKAYGGPPTNGVSVLSNTCYHVKGHQHFRGNNHIDPGPYWDWDRFYRLVNSDPTPKVFTDKKGTIYDSGGQGNNYGDQQRRTYLIQPAEATSIELRFEAFELEGSPEKPYDYLDIYDGPDANGEFLGRFTGNRPPAELIAKSGAVFMEFRSDCQINKAGWQIRYQSRSKNPDCANPSDLVASNIFPMGATLNWKGSAGVDGYVVYLRRKLEDKWAAFPVEGSSATLTGLSANALYQWQVQSVCGSDSSALIGQSFITPNVNRNGQVQVFSIRLNSGRFHDSGGTFAGYANNENYLYRILPPDGGRVQLKFRSFETENELDMLTVYDGLNLDAPKLGTFSGNDLPPTITSSGNGLTLHFQSDNRTNGKGWEAAWRSIGGTIPPPKDPDPTPDPPVSPPPSTDPTPDPGPITGNEPFEPEFTFPADAPSTKALLKGPYESSFTLKFDDQDKSGRGMANRFFAVAQETSGGLQANSKAGFFFDDFNRGLHSQWKQVSGNWKVDRGQLIQTNVTASNSNLWTDLTQTGEEVYLYHWRARMTGDDPNRRHGLHFFCSDPEQEDRGTSYFVWIRDGSSGDYAEIYKTVNNQFERKSRRAISIETGQIYDFKTIYNPQKGRIEVYVNDKFSGSWVDRYPLKSGKGISLRSGNCVVAYDDLTVYQSRKSSERITVGPGSSSMLPNQGSFLVRSLVIDRSITWSPVSVDQSSIGTSSTPPPPPGDESGQGLGLASSYTGSFPLQLDTKGSQRSFYLLADQVGQQWRANEKLGFLIEEFPGSKLPDRWGTVGGSWQVQSGSVQQIDASVGNSNLYTSLTQRSDQVYLYHFRARVQSSGDNRRFGLHFFATDGSASQRGSSYMVWFRYHESKADLVEVYRFDNNSAPRIQESSLVALRRNQWHDIKIVYDPTTGLVQTYLDQQLVLSWTDTGSALQQGSAISFRTGNSVVEFDDLKVYQVWKGQPINVTVGNSSTDMIRLEGTGSQTNARLYQVDQLSNGRWNPPQEFETQIK